MPRPRKRPKPKTVGKSSPKKQRLPIEYRDETGLYSPMRLAILTGRPPSDFKNLTDEET